ncbi:MAG TPA: MarR family transcriptional regulator [Thermoanaerobaculia bacterium]|nr:MarR family transcriptional regulator [Thermoanaerobaculia bacterium]
MNDLAFRVIGAAHEVEGRLEGALGAIGLSLAKLNVLKALAGTDEPLPLSHLADRCCCVRSNITQLVDRLEAERLVERLPDPADRRSVRAALTPAGRERHADAVRIVGETERQVFAGLGEEDRQALARLLGRLGAQA